MKTCKYCGDAFKGTGGSVCMKCREKEKLLPQFAKARDRVRRLAGLPPLSGENSRLVEFANRLKKRVKGVGVHNAIDCVLMEMLNE